MENFTARPRWLAGILLLLCVFDNFCYILCWWSHCIHFSTIPEAFLLCYVSVCVYMILLTLAFPPLPALPLVLCENALHFIFLHFARGTVDGSGVPRYPLETFFFCRSRVHIYIYICKQCGRKAHRRSCFCCC